MIKVLVSACLLGQRVRYDGGSITCRSSVLDRWQAQGRLVPFCPEVAAGFPVPRPPAEIAGGDGQSVLAGRACVVDHAGRDVTTGFLAGARAAAEAARRSEVRLAILKEASPSCGSTWIHDGTFSGRQRAGLGVTAACLIAQGLHVFSEAQIQAADECLMDIERHSEMEL